MKRGNQPGEKLPHFISDLTYFFPQLPYKHLYLINLSKYKKKFSLSLAVRFESVQSIIFGPRVHRDGLDGTRIAIIPFKKACTRYLTPSTIDERTLVARRVTLRRMDTVALRRII